MVGLFFRFFFVFQRMLLLTAEQKQDGHTGWQFSGNNIQVGEKKKRIPLKISAPWTVQCWESFQITAAFAVVSQNVSSRSQSKLKQCIKRTEECTLQVCAHGGVEMTENGAVVEANKRTPALNARESLDSLEAEILRVMLLLWDPTWSER